MKPVISPVQDAVLSKNFRSIQQCLDGGVSLDNMNILVIEGTTANVQDTQAKIAHSMVPRPIGWQLLIGDVYVQEINNDFIDVRSTKPSVNFKIILFGGSPVTGESLVEVGSAGYLSTTEVIQQTPQITITNIEDATITIQPIGIKSSVGQCVLAGSSNNVFMSIVNDANYWYCTQGTSASTTTLARVAKIGGQVTTLTLGTRQLGPMTISGDHLYVMQQTWDGVNAILIFDVSISGWSLTSTFTITVSNTQDVSYLIVDGANFYYTHRNGASNQVPQVSKCTIATSAATTTSLRTPASTNIVGKKIIDTGTHLWILDESTGLESSVITKILKSSLAVVSNTTIPGPTGMHARNMVYDGTYIYFPSYMSANVSTNIGNYVVVMNIFDPVGIAFTTVPLVGAFQNNSASNTYAMMLGNIRLLDGYAFIPYVGDGGFYINRFDPNDNSQTLGWFPIFGGNNASTMAIDTFFQVDSVDGLLTVILAQGVTSGVRNFEYVKPDFSNL